MAEKDMVRDLADSELVSVTGGGGYFEYKDDGRWEYWYKCSYCGKHKELVVEGSDDMGGFMISKKFVCPNCGMSEDYSLSFNM